MIPSFGGHIAHRLWTQDLDSRPASRFRLRLAKARVMRLERFRWPSAETRQLVDASWVSHLGRVMSWNLDLPLLLAFVERWQPDTNTFHMPFGEITITLYDVLYLLRLSIRGTHLSSEGEKTYVSQLTTMLNVDGDEIRRKCYRAGGFHLDHGSLREQLMRI